MDNVYIAKGLLRLVRRLEPSLGRREPSILEFRQIIEDHGLADRTVVELARMGWARKKPS